MITSLPADLVTPAELLAGYRAMVHLASNAAAALGQPIESLLPVDAARREAGRPGSGRPASALGGGLPALAACDLVAALAHNPWDAEARDPDPRAAGLISQLALIGAPPQMRGFNGPGIPPVISPDARIEAFASVDAGVARATRIGSRTG